MELLQTLLVSELVPSLIVSPLPLRLSPSVPPIYVFILFCLSTHFARYLSTCSVATIVERLSFFRPDSSLSFLGRGSFSSRADSLAVSIFSRVPPYVSSRVCICKLRGGRASTSLSCRGCSGSSTERRVLNREREVSFLTTACGVSLGSSGVYVHLKIHFRGKGSRGASLGVSPCQLVEELHVFFFLLSSSVLVFSCSSLLVPLSVLFHTAFFSLLANYLSFPQFFVPVLFL